MISGIFTLLKALKPIPTPEMVRTMEITGERKAFLLLSDEHDGTSGYAEFDSLTEAMNALECLQEDEGMRYLRIRSTTGYRFDWEHPDTRAGTAETRSEAPTYLILIDYQDGSTGYEEHDSPRFLAFGAEDLRADPDLSHFRMRHPDGSEFCWENPCNAIFPPAGTHSSQ